MKIEPKYKVNIIDTIPILGIVVFVCLYLFSSTLYPGGSQANLNTVGYDWINNYWCNLLNEEAMNGIPNPARPFAIIAMIILCTSLSFFFFQFANYFSKNQIWNLTIKISGVFSMIFAILFFTEFHDLMTMLSSIFGLFVVLGILKEIIISELEYFKIGGGFIILLLGLNNFIYYTQNYIILLPLLQKITLLTVLIWIVRLNIKIVRDKEGK